MREAGLSDPVILTVPDSGRALMTMATPVDPSPGDRNRSLIWYSGLCHILGRWLLGLLLRPQTRFGIVMRIKVCFVRPAGHPVERVIVM